MPKSKAPKKRPKSNVRKKKALLTVRCLPEEKEALVAMCKGLGISVSSYLHDLAFPKSPVPHAIVGDTKP